MAEYSYFFEQVTLLADRATHMDRANEARGGGGEGKSGGADDSLSGVWKVDKVSC